MKKIADYHLAHNFELQFLQAIQEFAELQVEITKWKLGKVNYKEFLEEIFDAEFMILQLKRMMIKSPHDQTIFLQIVTKKIGRELMRHEL